MLTGEAKEVRIGDRAARQRICTFVKLPTTKIASSRLKSFCRLAFDIPYNEASIVNFSQTDLPFGFNFSFNAENYAKNAGDLILVRPRVLGTKTIALMETKEPRRFPIDFERPVLDTDTFEITLPGCGCTVATLPSPVDADFGFASYHSKSEITGNVIRYTRAFEVKDLSVPVNKADDLKKFYRIVATDERNTAVLKPSK